MNDMRTRIVLGCAAALISGGLAMTYVQAQATAAPQAQAATTQQGGAQGAPTPPVVRMSEGAGSTIFGNTCENCHGKLDSAPAPALLKKMTPEHIYDVLTTGSMVPMAKDLTDQQKKDIAEWVGGRKLETGDIGAASKMPNQCSVSRCAGSTAGPDSSPLANSIRSNPMLPNLNAWLRWATTTCWWANGVPSAVTVAVA